MTWGEFKARMEEEGVTDETVIFKMNFGYMAPGDLTIDIFTVEGRDDLEFVQAFPGTFP